MGEAKFIAELLPSTVGKRSWTTSMVYGEPKGSGKLPHPPGRGDRPFVRLGEGLWRGFVEFERL